MDKKYIFKLFLAGLGPEDQTKIVNLKKILKSTFEDDFNLEVVNVLENPELAESQEIVATPTMIRETPVPVQKSMINLRKSDDEISSEIAAMKEDNPGMKGGGV